MKTTDESKSNSRRSTLQWTLGAVGLAAIIALTLTAWSFFKAPEVASGPVEAVALETVSTEVNASTKTSAAATGATLYTVGSDGSEARFLIDEVLRGDDVTVVGTTNQVTAEFSIDFADASEAQLSTILVNVRDLATDSDFRDRAIKNKILLTATR